MLRPVDPRILEALVCHDDEVDVDLDFILCQFIKQAKTCLNINRNLSIGVHLLLLTYGPFLAQLYLDEAPMYHDKNGADSWHIDFRDPPFDDLRIHSTSARGVIDIYVHKKPFLSFQMFDKPQNWQAMLQWVWDHGDKRQTARSIPQLDPHKMRILLDGSDDVNGGDQMDTGGLPEGRLDYRLIHDARKAFAIGDIHKGMHTMLFAFHIFRPISYEPTLSSPCIGPAWRISFSLSPFRSLRLQPGQSQGVVDIYSFEEHAKSMQITDNPKDWQALLEWLWDYGNERHIARADYESSHPRPRSKAKSKSKQPRTQKPLLHQVLRTAGFKAQSAPTTNAKELKHKAKAKDTRLDRVDGMTRQCRALHPASPNRRIGKSRLATSTTADDEVENGSPKAGVDRSRLIDRSEENEA